MGFQMFSKVTFVLFTIVCCMVTCSAMRLTRSDTRSREASLRRRLPGMKSFYNNIRNSKNGGSRGANSTNGGGGDNSTNNGGGDNSTNNGGGDNTTGGGSAS